MKKLVDQNPRQLSGVATEIPIEDDQAPSNISTCVYRLTPGVVCVKLAPVRGQAGLELDRDRIAFQFRQQRADPANERPEALA